MEFMVLPTETGQDDHCILFINYAAAGPDISTTFKIPSELVCWSAELNDFEHTQWLESTGGRDASVTHVEVDGLHQVSWTGWILQYGYVEQS